MKKYFLTLAIFFVLIFEISLIFVNHASAFNCLGSTNPWVKIISPNGGENYETGETVRIEWEGCNLPFRAMTRMMLVRNLPNESQNNFLILETTDGYELANNYYDWKIPRGIEPADNYFLSIVCGQGDENCSTGTGDNVYAITDDSDLFAINKPSDFPLGCHSNEGYSPTTGQPCGCNGSRFSSYNGQRCLYTNQTVPAKSFLLTTPYFGGCKMAGSVPNQYNCNILISVENISSRKVWIPTDSSNWNISNIYPETALSINYLNGFPFSYGSNLFIQSDGGCGYSGNCSNKGDIYLAPNEKRMFSITYLFSPNSPSDRGQITVQLAGVPYKVDSWNKNSSLVSPIYPIWKSSPISIY